MIKDEGANYILNDSSDQFQIKRDMVGPLNKVTVVILFITLIYIQKQYPYLIEFK